MKRQRVCPYDEGTTEAEQWFRDYTEQRIKDRTWKPRKKGHDKPKPVIATIDFETDPFAGPGQGNIEPFAAGFYDGTTYHSFWGNDCHVKLAEHIRSLDKPHILYAHNGGRFDFSFLLPWIESNVFCIGSRIVRAYIRGIGSGYAEPPVHELRDSYSILPVPLKLAAEKYAFDYDKMKRGKRDRYRMEILDYLKQDCIGLHAVVVEWRNTFGNGLTMASAAMRSLNASMGSATVKRTYEPLTEKQDEELRQFYYGGRVQCFERGILKGDWKIYDITSSYPNVMRNYLHPVSAGYRRGLHDINENTDFAIVDATSNGHLPQRNTDTGKLEFPVGRYTFHATGHELRTALELGVVRIHKVIEAREAHRRCSFKDFIDEYWSKRKLAQECKDETYSLFWKLVMNSAYGKFAQNPRNFKDRLIIRDTEDAPEEGWQLATRFERYDIYERASDMRFAWRSFLNVGTGASICGAARAELMRGIKLATRVVYCDTDSVIATNLPQHLQSPDLGFWKQEAIGHTVAICERKLYALFGSPSSDPKVTEQRIRQWEDPTCVKLASKGVRLKAHEIVAACQGHEIVYTPLAPTIRLDGSQVWTQRRVKMAA